MKYFLTIPLLLATAAPAAITPSAPAFVGLGNVTDYAAKAVWDQGGVLGGLYIHVGQPVREWRALPGVTADVTDKDIELTRTTGAAQVSDFRLDWQLSPAAGSRPVTRGTSAPAVITPDPADPMLWTYVGNGTADITITAEGAAVYTRRVTTSTTGSGTTEAFKQFVPGSLRKHLADHFALLEGNTPAANMPIYSARNTSTGVYTRNLNLWTTVDLTGTTANTWGGIAIAPDMVLYSGHAHPPVGATVHFVAADNTTVSRTISAGHLAPGYTPYWPDWWLARLDSALPGTITPAKFLPADWAAWLPDLAAGGPAWSRLPSIGLNQWREATVQEIRTINNSEPKPLTTTIAPQDPTRLAFYKTKVGGDSSSPLILPINNQPVLATVWTYGGAGSGTSLTSQRSQIDAAMEYLDDAPYVSLPLSGTDVSSVRVLAPSRPDLQLSGEMTLTARAKATDWTPAYIGYLIGKWQSVGPESRQYCLTIAQNTGLLEFRYSIAGTAGGLVSSSVTIQSATGAVDNSTKLWLRAHWVANTGAGQYACKFYTSADGVTWTQLGATRTGVTPAPLHTGASPISVGGAYNATNNTSTSTFSGRIYYADIRGGSPSSPILAKFDPFLSSPTGYTDPVNSTVWTIAGNPAFGGSRTQAIDLSGFSRY